MPESSVIINMVAADFCCPSVFCHPKQVMHNIFNTSATDSYVIQKTVSILADPYVIQ